MCVSSYVSYPPPERRWVPSRRTLWMGHRGREDSGSPRPEHRRVFIFPCGVIYRTHFNFLGPFWSTEPAGPKMWSKHVQRSQRSFEHLNLGRGGSHSVLLKTASQPAMSVSPEGITNEALSTLICPGVTVDAKDGLPYIHIWQPSCCYRV